MYALWHSTASSFARRLAPNLPALCQAHASVCSNTLNLKDPYWITDWIAWIAQADSIEQEIAFRDGAHLVLAFEDHPLLDLCFKKLLAVRHDFLDIFLTVYNEHCEANSHANGLADRMVRFIIKAALWENCEDAERRIASLQRAQSLLKDRQNWREERWYYMEVVLPLLLEALDKKGETTLDFSAIEGLHWIFLCRELENFGYHRSVLDARKRYLAMDFSSSSFSLECLVALIQSGYKDWPADWERWKDRFEPSPQDAGALLALLYLNSVDSDRGEFRRFFSQAFDWIYSRCKVWTASLGKAICTGFSNQNNSIEPIDLASSAVAAFYNGRHDEIPNLVDRLPSDAVETLPNKLRYLMRLSLRSFSSYGGLLKGSALDPEVLTDELPIVFELNSFHWLARSADYLGRSLGRRIVNRGIWNAPEYARMAASLVNQSCCEKNDQKDVENGDHLFAEPLIASFFEVSFRPPMLATVPAELD